MSVVSDNNVVANKMNNNITHSVATKLTEQQFLKVKSGKEFLKILQLLIRPYGLEIGVFVPLYLDEHSKCFQSAMFTKAFQFLLFWVE